jgi:hypothetical protein
VSRIMPSTSSRSKLGTPPIKAFTLTFDGLHAVLGVTGFHQARALVVEFS